MQNEVIAYDNLQPNPWNPNAMNERQYQAEIESICSFGFIDPITVRTTQEDTEQREIIDGEHRWKAFGEIRAKWLAGNIEIAEHAKSQLLPLLEANEVPCVNLGALPDVAAKKLTIILNETRGRANTADLAALLAEIATLEPTEGLGVGLPYGEAELKDLLKLAEFDWNNLPQHGSGEGNSGEGQGETETFETVEAALPQSAHTVWMLAFDKVKAKLAEDGQSLNADEKIANGQVLELIAADYIAGA